MNFNKEAAKSYLETQNFSPNLEYIRLGSKKTTNNVVGLDSSDQLLLSLDSSNGIAAHRSGIVILNTDNQILAVNIKNIEIVDAYPSVSNIIGLRSNLGLQHTRRLRSYSKTTYSPLEAPIQLISPRLIAATERECFDEMLMQDFLRSQFAHPQTLILRDGRLMTPSNLSSSFIDHQYRYATSKGVKVVGIAKTAKVLDIVRPQVRTCRKQIGTYIPFAVEITDKHLEKAYPDQDRNNIRTYNSLRHGNAVQAKGGAGAIRYALSTRSNELYLVEFNLYDLHYFKKLLKKSISLEEWGYGELGRESVFSSDIKEFITDLDREQLIIPTLEEIVYTSFTDTEIGLYPRALANIHDRVKLRHAEIEPLRREIIADLYSTGIPDDIQFSTSFEDPHKTDFEIVNAMHQQSWN